MMSQGKGSQIMAYRPHHGKGAHWRDYVELTKPNVVALMVLTSWVGMCLSTPGWVPFNALIFGNLGIALCAGAAAVINQVVDRRVDVLMTRTKKRPLAQGNIAPLHACIFALILSSAGMLLLIFLVNSLTAWLTFASVVGYAIIYTAILKRATPQNIVIGGLAGAAPPLLGWTAVTDSIDSHALLLVLIIFAWTPPHFWALAIHRKEEYAHANIPMLPVTHGEKYTKLHILLYTLILQLVIILPFLIGMAGFIYIVGSVILGSRFLYWSIVLIR
ncbi:MAG: heme o synthase, partial [Endozoicomonas sp. (ex Botrylloides leachii)]|nr:heme o synthase [Endozoicomonas sp. (ex Botrylloides leachii)]